MIKLGENKFFLKIYFWITGKKGNGIDLTQSSDKKNR